MSNNETLPGPTCQGMILPEPPQPHGEAYNAKLHTLRALTLARRALQQQDFELAGKWLADAQKWLDQVTELTR